MQAVYSRLVPALILGLFLYIGFILMTHQKRQDPALQSFTNWQEADAPYGLPTKGGKSQQFDPRFQLHSAFERALIPSAPRFDYPIGSEHGALSYNAQPFWEMNHSRGGRHTGDDLNGIGGQNTDKGDPVYATANGLVVYAGTPSPGWGKTVILAHRDKDGRILHSMYAHLDRINVAPLTHIARGSTLGTIGDAGKRYWAHLHFEMRHADGVCPQNGYTRYRFDRLDPSATVKDLRGADATDLHPSVLATVQLEAKADLPPPAMDTESFNKYLDFMNR